MQERTKPENKQNISDDILQKYLLFSGTHILLVKNNKDEYHLPEPDNSAHGIQSLGIGLNNDNIVGVYNDHRCHTFEIGMDDNELQKEQPPQHQDNRYTHAWTPLKSALHLLSEEWFPVVSRAYQILRWDKNHSFCGCCGGPTIKNANRLERRCQQCDLYFYPKLAPAIIVLIRDGDKVLLGRKAEFPNGNYGLIAGFVEAGEKLEETVCREVKEEVNIDVKNIKYFGSQSWPFPDSLMIGFTADYAGGDIKLNDGELDHAAWFERGNMPNYPKSSVSIARHLIDSYINNT